jgi:neutral ceramidase
MMAIKRSQIDCKAGLGGVLLVLVFLMCPLSAQWEVGVAKSNITPTESVPLAGYSGRTRMSSKTEHPIWLKALAIRDGTGHLSVLVTSDLVGLSTKMVDVIASRALANHRLPRDRLILNASHNHSCPVTEDVLWLYYELSPDEVAARDRYTHWLYSRYEEVIAGAIENLEPAELFYEQGLAGVAVNRRRSRGPDSRALPGPVDHDIPVLAVKKKGEIKGIVFGYSCHTTALGGLSINGDYAGFAQLALEETIPGCIALFVQNCGGDANPLPRIRGRDKEATEIAGVYGLLLAEGVRQVLQTPMKSISGPLRVACAEASLTLEAGLSQEELSRLLPTAGGITRREYEHFLNQYRTLGGLPDHVTYPVQVWQFGSDLTLIAMTGETVVDYSLKFKSSFGWNDTWVCGYNNDLLSYVPSQRVLREGGYEGTTGMYEYGHRAPYTDDVEDRITHLVEQLVTQVRGSIE